MKMFMYIVLGCLIATTVHAQFDGNGAFYTEKLRVSDAIRSDAPEFGSAFASWSYGKRSPEHKITDNAGNYDATGGTYDNMFTDSTNSPFTQADQDAKNYIIINSGAWQGAKIPIRVYVAADTVLTEAGAWTGDFTAVNYSIMPAPEAVFLDGGHIHFHPPIDGHFGIGQQDSVHTYANLFKVRYKAGADDLDNITISHDSNGYSNVDAMQFRYETGDTQAADALQVIQITVDETGATGGEIDLIYLETTDANGIEKHGIHVGTGFDMALTVSGASAIDMDYGYTVLANHTVTDRVNGGAGAGNAFLEAGNDVQVLVADNDYILIGDDNEFEIHEVILVTGSSANLNITTEYSTGNGTWSTLVVDDGTAGFQSSGQLKWNAPGDWAKSNKADGVTGDITSAYYIRVTRTRNNVVTKPTEDYFKIYAEQSGDTGMNIYGDGVIKLPYLGAAPSAPANGMIWMESDGLHVYYNGAEKLVGDGAP